MKKTILIAILLAGILDQASAASLSVAALIDGRSQLIIKGDTIRWHHLTFDAPGRNNGEIQPTLLNCQEWFPDWPDVSDAANFFCGCSDSPCGCDSSSYTNLDPALAESPVPASITLLAGWTNVKIIQQPSVDNGYELIVEFNTNFPIYSSWYQFVVEYEADNDPVTPGTPVRINPGLNDAWFNPETAGQGFFINVFPDIRKMFLSWFTYDTERPDESITAELGEPGHRWLTAFGDYSRDTAVLEIEMTSGGIFDASPPVPTQVPDGSISLNFASCNAATVIFDIPSIDMTGEIPIQRITLDNVDKCEAASHLELTCELP